jgi:CheY-like chemotaxis protein
MKSSQHEALLPLLEFPSKVVIVDDNIEFIKSLQMFSSQRGLQFVAFTDPRKALPYLQKYNYCQFVDKYLTPEDGAEMFFKKVNIDLSLLYQEIYNPKRFDEISLLIVDYAMPGINGQEFCNKVMNLPIKKLLLTGEASYEKAVTMFNSGTIHKFIRKDEDPDLLFESINYLRNKYFQTITQDLLFTLQNRGNSSIFSDELFIRFFKSLCKEKGFVEYYLADNDGSYLLADKVGTLKLLIVKSEEEMKVLYELAEGDLDTTHQLLNALRKREKIAFFQSLEKSILPITQWHLHDASRIEGSRQTYYYALVDANPDCSLDYNKITSYQSYLKQNP